MKVVVNLHYYLNQWVKLTELTAAFYVEGFGYFNILFSAFTYSYNVTTKEI